MSSTLGAVAAFCLGGAVLELIVNCRTLKSLHQELRLSGNDASLDDGLRPQAADVQNYARRLIRFAELNVLNYVSREESQVLTSDWAKCSEIGRELISHLAEVSNYLWEQRRLARDPSARRRDFKLVPVKVEHHKIEDYQDHLTKLIRWGSNQVIASLKTATFSSFAVTSLTQEQFTSGLHDILLLLSGGGQKIKPADLEDDGFVQQCINLATQVRLDTTNFIDNEPPSRALTATVFRRKSILALLDFPQMSDRIGSVDEAFQKTLEWIFRDDEYKIAWSSFPDFLESDGSLPYWLNGKAGSGKSTLLRFLIRHDKAIEHLQAWSGSRRLMTAHFFAWNLGTTLQKTRLGLLQSLIHQVLDTDQSLIHQIFPDLWHKIGPNMVRKLTPLSLIEIKRAFTRLLDLTNGRRCFCFFIDGIDEFDDDIDETADLLLSLRAPSLKFVLSSRPIDICLDKFATCPQLRLQDLTAGDIQIYIDGKLSSHHSMVDLMNEDARAAQELINELEKRASGVFLWVRLVVNELLVGLREGDSIEDLKIRLRALPPDLSDLYASMFGKMKPGYLQQAAKLFRLVRSASALLDGQAIPTQFLAVACHDFQSVINKKPVAFETRKLVHWCTIVGRQLVSRCCGLVEISHSTYKPDWWHADLNKLPATDADLLASHIQFLHRTVAEYLYEHGVWSKIMRQTSTFEPCENLAYAALHMMKIAPLADTLSSMQAYRWAQTLVQSTREYERRQELPLESLLDEMNLVLRHHCPEPAHWSSLIEIYPTGNASVRHLSVLSKPLVGMRSFAAFVGLGMYLDSKIEREGFVSVGPIAQQIMLQTLFAQSDDWTGINLTDQVDVVCCLLQHGADPNEASEGPSLWQCCLERLVGMVCVEPSVSFRVKNHRARGRRQMVSDEGIANSENSPCSCSLDECNDWTQLMVACVNAGARLVDLRYLVNMSSISVTGTQCCYAQLCQLIYNVSQEVEGPTTSEDSGTVVPELPRADGPGEPFKNTSYGPSTVSGNAKAHFGDAYNYGSNVIINNYYSDNAQRISGTTTNLICPPEELSTSSPSSRRDVQPNENNEARKRAFELGTDVIAAIRKAKALSLAVEEADHAKRRHERGQRLTESTDRTGSNTRHGTDRVSDHRSVPNIKGIPRLDYITDYGRLERLRIEEDENDIAISTEDIFDESFSDTAPRASIFRQDAKHFEYKDSRDRSRGSSERIIMKPTNSNHSDWHTNMPGSQNIAVPQPKKESDSDRYGITSGSVHHLKSFQD